MNRQKLHPQFRHLRGRPPDGLLDVQELEVKKDALVPRYRSTHHVRARCSKQLEPDLDEADPPFNQTQKPLGFIG